LVFVWSLSLEKAIKNYYKEKPAFGKSAACFAMEDLLGKYLSGSFVGGFKLMAIDI